MDYLNSMGFPYISILETVDGKVTYHLYDPKDDITAYELSKIIMLFGPNNPQLYNNWGFIINNNLQRHFS